MDIWCQNIKTGEAWILDNDSTKPVYNDSRGVMQLDLKDISLYRFTPENPNAKEQEKVGYQFDIFDFLEVE